jgi:hypothetical protein
VDYFKRACGTARRVWNWALNEWNKQYAAGGRPNAMALKKQSNAIKFRGRRLSRKLEAAKENLVCSARSWNTRRNATERGWLLPIAGIQAADPVPSAAGRTRR